MSNLNPLLDDTVEAFPGEVEIVKTFGVNHYLVVPLSAQTVAQHFPSVKCADRDHYPTQGSNHPHVPGPDGALVCQFEDRALIIELPHHSGSRPPQFQIIHGNHTYDGFPVTGQAVFFENMMAWHAETEWSRAYLRAHREKNPGRPFMFEVLRYGWEQRDLALLASEGFLDYKTATKGIVPPTVKDPVAARKRLRERYAQYQGGPLEQEAAKMFKWYADITP